MLDVSINENHLNETQVVFVNLKGALDSEKAIDFYDFINAELIKGFRKFVIDCTRLEYISSSGISIMLRLKHKLDEKESVLVYYGFNKEISLLLRFFGLEKNLLITDNSDNAVKLISSGNDDFSQDGEIYSLSDGDENTKSEPIFKKEDENKKESLYEPISIQIAESNTASLLDPETAQKIKSNRLTLTDEYEVLEEEPTSDIEEVATEPVLESITESHPELKINLPFISRTETNPSLTTIMDSITEFDSDHTERYEVRSLSHSEDKDFTVLVLNCGNCGSKIRVRKQGKQQCPRCEYKFLLRQSGSISTIERLS